MWTLESDKALQVAAKKHLYNWEAISLSLQGLVLDASPDDCRLRFSELSAKRRRKDVKDVIVKKEKEVVVEVPTAKLVVEEKPIKVEEDVSFLYSTENTVVSSFNIFNDSLKETISQNYKNVHELLKSNVDYDESSSGDDDDGEVLVLKRAGSNPALFQEKKHQDMLIQAQNKEEEEIEMTKKQVYEKTEKNYELLLKKQEDNKNKNNNMVTSIVEDENKDEARQRFRREIRLEREMKKKNDLDYLKTKTKQEVDEEKRNQKAHDEYESLFTRALLALGGVVGNEGEGKEDKKSSIPVPLSAKKKQVKDKGPLLVEEDDEGSETRIRRCVLDEEALNAIPQWLLEGSAPPLPQSSVDYNYVEQSSLVFDIGMDDKELDELLSQVKSPVAGEGSELMDVLQMLDRAAEKDLEEMRAYRNFIPSIPVPAEQPVISSLPSPPVTVKKVEAGKEKRREVEIKEKREIIPNEKKVIVKEKKATISNKGRASRFAARHDSKEDTGRESDEEDEEWSNARDKLKAQAQSYEKDKPKEASTPALPFIDLYERNRLMREEEERRLLLQEDEESSDGEMEFSNPVVDSSTPSQHKSISPSRKKKDIQTQNVALDFEVDDEVKAVRAQKMQIIKQKADQTRLDRLEQELSLKKEKERKDREVEIKQIVEKIDSNAVEEMKEEEEDKEMGAKEKEDMLQRELQRKAAIEKSILTSSIGVTLYDKNVSYSKPFPTLPLSNYTLDVICIIEDNCASSLLFLSLVSYFLSSQHPQLPYRVVGAQYTVALSPFSSISLIPPFAGDANAKRVMLLALENPSNVGLTSFLTNTPISSLLPSYQGSLQLSDVCVSVSHATNGFSKDGKVDASHLFDRIPSFYLNLNDSKKGKDKESVGGDLACFLLKEECVQNQNVLNKVLESIVKSGLDVVGLRGLYFPKLERDEDYSNAQEEEESVEERKLVFVVCVRGVDAVFKLLEVFGPEDPSLAKLTDPHSLRAIFGGSSRKDNLSYIPPSIFSNHRSLISWFGGRVPQQEMPMSMKDRKKVILEEKHSKLEKERTKQEHKSRPRPVFVILPYKQETSVIFFSSSVSMKIISTYLTECIKNGFKMIEGGRVIEGGKDVFAFILSRENAMIQLHSLISRLKTNEENKLQDGNKELIWTFIDAAVLKKELSFLSFSPPTTTTALSHIGSMPPSFYFKDELENVAVVVILPHVSDTVDGIKEAPWSILKDLSEDGFQVLAIKAFSSLSDHPAREIASLLSSTSSSSSSHREEVVRKLSVEGCCVLTVRRKRVKEHLLTLCGGKGSEVKKGSQTWRSKFDSSSISNSSSFTSILLCIEPKSVYRMIGTVLKIEELREDANVISESKGMPLSNLNRFNGWFYSSSPVTSSVVILKGEAMRKKLLPRIFKQLIKNGFEIVDLCIRDLLMKEKELLFQTELNKEGGDENKLGEVNEKDFFESLSSPVCVLVVKRENGINTCFDIFGAEDPLIARSQNEFSIRASYGTSKIDNVAYISPSYTQAVKDVEVFQFDYKEYLASTKIEGGNENVMEKNSAKDTSPLCEASLLLLTPSAAQDNEAIIEILTTLLNEGFSIIGLCNTYITSATLQQYTSIWGMHKDIVSIISKDILGEEGKGEESRRKSIVIAVERDNGCSRLATIVGSSKAHIGEMASGKNASDFLYDRYNPFIFSSRRGSSANKEIPLFFTHLISTSSFHIVS